MKDKEMIEEMAKDLKECLPSDWYWRKSVDSDTYCVANHFYNTGYRKLSEDSIALSKEELEEKYEPSEKFMSVARELEDLKQNLEDKVLLLREEYVKEINEKEDLARGNIALHNEVDGLHRINYELKEELKQARKGKAEKIFKTIKEGLSKYDNHYKIEKNNFIKWLKEIAKQFGVEIKE